MIEWYWYTVFSLVIWILFYVHSGKYVRPRWKQPGKLIFYVFVSTIFGNYFGLYSVIFIVLHPLIGLIFHIKACKKHNINWITCAPIDKYITLQEKWARGDFS